MTSGRQGFALPAVLTIISVLTLVYLATIFAMTNLKEGVRRDAEAVEFERTALTIQARVAYLAAVSPLGPDRIQVEAIPLDPATEQPFTTASAETTGVRAPRALFLDDRPYAWTALGGPGEGATIAATSTPIIVRLQDETGLVNLDYADAAILNRLFSTAGASPGQAETLVQQYLDWTDSSGLKRVHGAGRDDYRNAGRSPPTGDRILRARDLHGLLGWNELMTPEQSSLIESVTQSDPRSPSFNVNTAPVDALIIEFGMSRDQAERTLSLRKIAPIYSLVQLGLASDREGLFTFPAGRLRLAVSDGRSPDQYRTTLVLTPDDPTRPIWWSRSLLTQGPSASTLDPHVAAEPFPVVTGLSPQR